MPSRRVLPLNEAATENRFLLAAWVRGRTEPAAGFATAAIKKAIAVPGGKKGTLSSQ